MMTCNPNWPEISHQLLPGQIANDRPDLVAHMFQMKKQAVMKDILEGALGRVCAYTYIIEVQKRGLPHMHLLLFFEAVHILRTPEDVDSLISATWPDLET